MTVAEHPTVQGQEVPVARRPQLPAVVLLIAGAVVAIIGCFLPWMTAVFPPTLPPTIDTAVTRNIFSSASQASLPGIDGKVIIFAALLSILLGLLQVRRARSVAAVFALLLATVAAITVVADYLDLLGAIVTFREIYFVQVDVGIGLYVTGLGAALWAPGAVLSGLAAGPESA